MNNAHNPQVWYVIAYVLTYGGSRLSHERIVQSYINQTD